MPDDATTLRARAAAHQREMTERQLLSPAQLAARWQLSPSTVRDIPAVKLPYLEFGQGLTYRRRRYHPDDVAAYERAHRRGASEKAA